MTNTSNKTTIGAILGGIAIAIEPIISNGDFEIKRDAGKLIIAAVIAVVGFYAKDYDKTGTPTPDTEKKS